MEQSTNSHSLNIIEENGLPAPSEPEQLTKADIESGTLLVMGRSHKQAIHTQWPEADVRLLSEYAGESTADVPDPYGGTAARYEEVFLHLKKYIDKFNW
ncbi:Low molecular weight phosphotyrosine protein phosphatase [Jeotgalicoccus coquinae]|nr:Low molecular weight phosphotyrosine protein phosphatase [Jeotgalicoccus coquinae]